jgi:hypothetical protein
MRVLLLRASKCNISRRAFRKADFDAAARVLVLAKV